MSADESVESGEFSKNRSVLTLIDEKSNIVWGRQNGESHFSSNVRTYDTAKLLFTTAGKTVIMGACS